MIFIADKKTANTNQDKATGKFVKGNSAAKKSLETELKELEEINADEPETKEKIRKYAQSKALIALKTAEQIMRSTNTKPADKLRCVELILAHAYGKPGTSVEEGDSDIKIIMEGMDEYSK